MIQIKRQIFTVEDYHKMGEAGILKPTDQVELVNGEIIQMSPIKSYHASIVDFLTEELIDQLKGKAIVRTQNPVLLNTISEPEPDLAIAEFRRDRYRHHHPTPDSIYLIIEVADSSLEFDRNVKRSLYAQTGIPEYWIVNINDKQVEVFQRVVNQQYTLQKIFFPGDLLSGMEVELEIAVADLFG